MKFTKWLETFIREKGIDLEETFTVEKTQRNFMSYGVIVEAIKNTCKEEQKAIKNMLVKIDFFNGDVKDYFRHLAVAIAI